jgi:colanic acid biosynthesis glycosyl transferase WcaI
MKNPKTITILTANFYPEDTAIGLYTTQFAQHLAKEYQVHIITGFPYYPQWEILDRYKNKNQYEEESLGAIKIYRYKQFVPKQVTITSRLKMIGSFVYGAFRNIKHIKETDLVICIVPFTFSILPAWWLAKQRKAKFWIHVQDFEFDLAFESGILSKKNLLMSLFKAFVFKFESFLLNKADVISSISQQMLAKVPEKSKHQEPFFFPNWISGEMVNPKNFKQHDYLEAKHFNLLYSGNVGEKQDWELFIQVAELLLPYQNIQITIVGHGTYIENLKIKTAHLTNLQYKSLVPLDALNDLLCSASMHFLFQKNDVLDTVMPSKLLGMMASGKPCLVTGHQDSEVKKILTQEVGFYISQADPQTVFNKIIEVFENPEKTNEMGQQAIDVVFKNFSQQTVLDNFSNKIKAIL